MEPILKWAGGKRQILHELRKYISLEKLEGHTYFEPFIGGGSVAFYLEYENTVINDSNHELTNVYEVVKNYPTELIEVLKEHQRKHSKDYYYEIREMDRSTEYQRLSAIDKAARFIYLNKTCFNGLYRVNAQGFYNVPIGNKDSVADIIMEDKIKKLSNYLCKNDIVIKNVDFELAVEGIQSGDFVYFDPPYDYEGAGFNAYVVASFSRNDLKRLRDLCNKLLDLNCKILVSNNDTHYVRELFSGDRYKINSITTKRFINCKGESRGGIAEVIIYGE